VEVVVVVEEEEEEEEEEGQATRPWCRLAGCSRCSWAVWWLFVAWGGTYQQKWEKVSCAWAIPSA